VLLLHALGQDSQQKNWRKLADTFHKKGYAVLLFDIRGHGDSTDVEPTEFWSLKYPSNRALVRGFPERELAFKNFDARYHPVLVNDIAAAKAFLDRRHDDGQCNSSNLVLVGADTGATLGAVWMNAEWHRHEVQPAAFPGQAPQIDATSQGKNILCAIWLSISPKLGGRSVNLPALVDLPGRRGEVPMIFVHGDRDAQAEKQARACDKSLKTNKKLALTAAVEIPGAGDLAGAALLQDKLGTPKALLDYIDSVMEERGKEWSEQDFRNKAFVWRFSDSARVMPASRPGDRTLLFNTYDPFVPRR
jgi:hypothetical protein